MKHINPPELGDSSDYGYTQIIVVPSQTSLAYIAGQCSGQSRDDYPDNFAGQVEKAFDHLRQALAAIRAAPEDIVKITILSVDHTDEKLRLVSAARKSFWPNHKPASTLIPVSRLASAGILFGVDAVVAIRSPA